jgi:hypothetical protein
VYQLIGKIARLLTLSNEMAFHLARLLAGICLLFAVYWLCIVCLPAGTVRQSAFLLVCFSSGLGWLLTITRLADTVVMPVDIRVPESSTFLTIMTCPHFILGVTLEVLTLIFYLGAGKHRGYLLAASLSLLLLSVTLVYIVIVVAAVLCGYTLIRCLQARRLWIPELRRTVAVGLPCAPVVGYYYLLLNDVPFWRIVYGEQDVVPSPGPVALFLGYGLVLGLAVWGLVHWARQRNWSSPRVLLTTWAIGNGLLLYAPLAFQGKLLAGWHVSLCLVAAVGLHDGLIVWVRERSCLARWVARSPRAPVTARNVVLILTIPSTLLVSLIGFRVALMEHYFPYFLPSEDVRVVRWLAAHSDEDDVLLSSYGIGNYWVGHSDGRSFLGHQFAVLEPEAKDRAMRRFYAGEAEDTEMRQLVEAYGITLVFYGSLERGLGDLRLEGMPWLVEVYRQGDVVVFEVRL